MDHICSKEKEIDKLLSCVYGNGEPGMKTDLCVIKERLGHILERMEGIPSSAKLKTYSFFGGAVGVIFGAIGMIIWKAMEGI